MFHMWFKNKSSNLFLRAIIELVKVFENEEGEEKKRKPELIVEKYSKVHAIVEVQNMFYLHNISVL